VSSRYRRGPGRFVSNSAITVSDAGPVKLCENRITGEVRS